MLLVFFYISLAYTWDNNKMFHFIMTFWLRRVPIADQQTPCDAIDNISKQLWEGHG
jgi:hypothetical protein